MVFLCVCVCAWCTGAQDEGSSGTTVCHAPTEAIRVSFVGCHLKCGAHMNREAVWAFRENMVTLSYRYELSLKVHLWGSKAPGKPQVTGTPLLWLQSVFLQRLARTMLRLLVIKNIFFSEQKIPQWTSTGKPAAIFSPKGPPPMSGCESSWGTDMGSDHGSSL